MINSGTYFIIEIFPQYTQYGTSGSTLSVEFFCVEAASVELAIQNFRGHIQNNPLIKSVTRAKFTHVIGDQR